MCPVQQRRIWREIIIWNISVETKVELDFIKILDKISILLFKMLNQGLMNVKNLVMIYEVGSKNPWISV